MTVKITDKFFEYNNKKYFRSNAQQIELCTHGEMKKPVMGANYLAPTAKIARKHLEKRPLKMVGPVSIDWSTVSQADLGASAKIKVFGIGIDASQSASLSQVRNDRMKLLGFYINSGPLMRCLNQDANAVRKAMADEGQDAQIVFFSWSAFDAELASHFESNFDKSVSISALGNDLAISVSGGKHGKQTVRLADGDTFAYANYKVKKWSKGKEQIEELEDEYYGMQ